MLNKIINKCARNFGYTFVKRGPSAAVPANGVMGNNLYALHNYLKADGSFDYARYKTIQVEGNKRKLENIWVSEDNIKFLSGYFQQQLKDIRLGLCHGTRRGKEQEWFKKYLPGNPAVIGTEISETAASFPDTIQWDFHEVKPEWVNATDFIYSNSFDHSYDPEKCLNAWMSCIRPGGLCVLEHTDGHSPTGANELDPFGADIVHMPYLITKWGKGRYSVRDILDAPADNGTVNYTAFIIVQKH